MIIEGKGTNTILGEQIVESIPSWTISPLHSCRHHCLNFFTPLVLRRLIHVIIQVSCVCIDHCFLDMFRQNLFQEVNRELTITTRNEL